MQPGSPEWSRLITASKVAAILGVSPWESPRSIWHKMRGDVPREPQKDHQARGHYLEPAILAWWRDQHPEHADYREQPDYKLGDWSAATPDATAILGTEGEADWHQVLVEAKSAANMDDWGEPGTDVIPAYYLVQVQWQMHVSGIHRCYVPAIGPRLKFDEWVVDYDADTGPLLEARMREFYDSLSADVPPPLDDSVATFNVIRKLHPEIERGESVEIDELEARLLIDRQADMKALEPLLRKSKATVLDLMGRAQYATCNGVRIARRQPRGDDVTFVITAKPSDLTDQENVA